MNANATLWDGLYLELADLLTTEITEIQWLDLWHNQVGFLDEEHPFSTPALFLGFRVLSTEDHGRLAQRLTVQLDVYYFYETFSDTFNGSFNQEDALGYLKTLSNIHKTLHGLSGTCFSEAKRTGFGPVDTGSAGNLYRQTFTMLVEDATAMPEESVAIPGDLAVNEGVKPVGVKPKPYTVLQ
ncbi:hypothetical protein [Maribacter sp. ACAM166]|uniref:hypothetical protein n=1 Tax=Maribacter sp. ACAM166 TaxID=2508996 RepID=UPI0010FE9FF9|nr:hypothetical protein [Maribacter sp. ACAM166]TLP81371.1 hypothetical protein ES765_05015 [Maribacter sp. ACAM166]